MTPTVVFIFHSHDCSSAVLARLFAIIIVRRINHSYLTLIDNDKGKSSKKKKEKILHNVHEKHEKE